MKRRAYRSRLAALLLALALGLAPSVALANEYDEERAAHPLRVVAYLLHPVGFAADWLLFRPVHWFSRFKPVRAVFGHDEV